LGYPPDRSVGEKKVVYSKKNPNLWVTAKSPSQYTRRREKKGIGPDGVPLLTGVC